MKTVLNTTGVKPISFCAGKVTLENKNLSNMLQVGKPVQHSAGGQGLLAALQDHLPSRGAEMLIRAINFTPAPDAPPKCLAEDPTFLQASKELDQHCLSKAEQSRACQCLVLGGRRAGWHTQGNQNQTNLSHSPQAPSLTSALMIILAWMICKTFEQVPSSTEHVVGSSKGTCHTCQECLYLFMLSLQESDTLNSNCF